MTPMGSTTTLLMPTSTLTRSLTASRTADPQHGFSTTHDYTPAPMTSTKGLSTTIPFYPLKYLQDFWDTRYHGARTVTIATLKTQHVMPTLRLNQPPSHTTVPPSSSRMESRATIAQRYHTPPTPSSHPSHLLLHHQDHVPPHSSTQRSRKCTPTYWFSQRPKNTPRLYAHTRELSTP